MNENIDLTKILKDCPIGTEFYHAGYGKVWFCGINLNNNYPILLSFDSNKINTFGVTSKGTVNNTYEGECLLFPSKEQRDWSKFKRFWDEPEVEKFDINTLQPYDKILARTSRNDEWAIEFYSDKKRNDGYIQGLVYSWKYVIPYNDETKHLLGTTDDCPEHYKWWKIENDFV